MKPIITNIDGSLYLDLEELNKGGAGSGNFGHSGRAGIRGGSGGGGMGGGGKLGLADLEVMTDYADSLSEQQRMAVIRYVGVSADDENYHEEGTNDVLNHYLRNNAKLDSDMSAQQRELDSAIQDSQITSDATLYRGSSKAPQLKVGDTFIDKGFASTSIEKDVAETFTDSPDTKSLFVIQAPAGTQGLYVEPITASGEQEVVLPRNSTFTVVDVNTTGSYPVYTVDLQLREAGVTP